MSVEENRFACDIFDMFAMYSSLVVSLMQTYLAQNAGAHGPVSVTFKSQFLTNRIRIQVNIAAGRIVCIPFLSTGPVMLLWFEIPFLTLWFDFPLTETRR